MKEKLIKQIVETIGNFKRDEYINFDDFYERYFIEFKTDEDFYNFRYKQITVFEDFNDNMHDIGDEYSIKFSLEDLKECKEYDLQTLLEFLVKAGRFLNYEDRTKFNDLKDLIDKLDKEDFDYINEILNNTLINRYLMKKGNKNE